MDDQAVFEVARKIHDGETRQAYLLQVCEGNPAMAKRVAALLKAHDQEDSFLENPPPGLSSTATIDAPMLEKPGSTIGPYKLLQQIGEGGMGVVYMAEQSHPLKRRVALKIIKPGMDTKQVVARFEAERQALAMMDHPNIAKVLDAGQTDSGRPYFVMELVKGVSITNFCDDHHLTPKERLELFVPVLQAVQHAHQKGVIHRDVKPSNVLIAEYDNQAIPKVIDFGVAKATSQLLTEKTMFTLYGQLIGTLEYMSPEQAKLNQMDIDTRSDIYSLGVLLYELLTGETPFDRKRLRSAAFDEMMRIIREEEPPRPSIKLTSSATLASVSANRSTEPKKLSMLVRGELDWIVMKAMEKERSRRYETPNAFAEDIQRFLNQEAIAARPASSSYRLKKFALRNRTMVVAGSLIAATLFLGFVISTWQAIVAIQERAKADWARSEAIQAKERAERAEEESSLQLAISRQHEAAAKALSQELTNEKTELNRQKEELRKSHYAASMNLIPAAWQAANTKRVAELLKEQKPVPGEIDLRGFEWHYWDRLCHPEHASRNLGKGFTGLMGYAAEGVGFFSRDGQRFFSLGREIREESTSAIVMRVLRTSDGNEIAKWDVPGNVASRFTSVNDNGTHLAGIRRQNLGGKQSVAVPQVQVLDAITGKELFSRAIAKATKVALSPDGKRLAVGIVPSGSLEIVPEGETKFSEICIFDLDEPQRDPLRLNGEDRFGIMALIFTSDGLRLISDERVYPNEPVQSRLCVWDTATGQRRASLLMKDHFITSIAISPDDSRLVGIGRSGPMLFLGSTNIYSWGGLSDDQLKLLRKDRLKESGLSLNLSRLIFHPDNQRILIWGDPSGTKLFDTTLGETVYKYKSSTNFQAAMFPADGSKLVTVGSETSGSSKGRPRSELPIQELVLQEWEVPATATEHSESLEAHSEQIVWNGSLTRYAQFVTTPLDNFKNSENTSDRRRVTICNSDDTAVLVFRKHGQPIISLKFSFDDRYICSQAGTGSPTETIVWEADTGNVVWSRTLAVESPQSLNSAIFSFDGKLAALPDENEIRIVSTADWKTIFTIADEHCLSFSRDSRRLITTSLLGENEDQTQAGEWKLWDVQMESANKTFPKSTTKGLSADGHWIATMDVNSHEIHIWDSATVEIKSTISGQDSSSRVVFSPDGTRIVVRSSFVSQPGIWDVDTGKLLFRLEGINSQALPHKGIAFSPDGKRIATAMMAERKDNDSQYTGIVTLWDATNGREYLKLSCPWTALTSGIEFSPDGFHLTARGHGIIDGLVPGSASVKTWNATPREPIVKP
jgi:serine/threonine protein kinase/WD40 repeat protein